MCSFFDNFNTLVKVNPGKIKNGSNYIKTYQLRSNSINKSININIITKRKRPKFEYLKHKKRKDIFSSFFYKYAFGFFAGRNSLSFRVTFKEYRQGLKASKFSLLLNQFNLDIERFIEVIEEVLINNFSLDFYENLFGASINDIDFKIHFLIVLKKSRFFNATKFYVIPKGCYMIHLRKILWYTLFFDILYSKFITTYYKGFKNKIVLIFLLIVFYISKLIHLNLRGM